MKKKTSDFKGDKEVVETAEVLLDIMGIKKTKVEYEILDEDDGGYDE